MRAKALGLGVVLVAAACSTFNDDGASGDDAGTDGSTSDGTTSNDASDAPALDSSDGATVWVPCKLRGATPFFCADFDEDSHAIYQSGGPVQPPPATAGGTTVTFGMPSVSPPSAIQIGTMGSDYALTAQGNTNVKVVTAAFDVWFEVLDPNPVYTIATVGVRNAAFDHCYAYLVFDMKKVRVESHCGSKTVDAGLESAYRHADVLGGLPIPKNWIHVELTMDLRAPAQKVTIKFGTASPIVHQLDATPDYGDVSLGGTPHFEIGVQGNMGRNETVYYDNILVTE